MAELENFVIMLDDLMEVHQHHWPISAESGVIDALRELRQHDGRPKLVARGQARMELRENKALINSQTGRLDRGAIYQVR